jgi:hypothetical protein
MKTRLKSVERYEAICHLRGLNLIVLKLSMYDSVEILSDCIVVCGHDNEVSFLFFLNNFKCFIINSIKLAI